jgi:hypothetical protein
MYTAAICITLQCIQKQPALQTSWQIKTDTYCMTSTAFSAGEGGGVGNFQDVTMETLWQKETHIAHINRTYKNL